jgi:hypothetical protein
LIDQEVDESIVLFVDEDDISVVDGDFSDELKRCH